MQSHPKLLLILLQAERPKVDRKVFDFEDRCPGKADRIQGIRALGSWLLRQLRCERRLDDRLGVFQQLTSPRAGGVRHAAARNYAEAILVVVERRPFDKAGESTRAAARV